jgi:hypothetical protein
VAATVPCWSGPEQWIAALEATLATEAGEVVRARYHVKVGTVLDVAAVEARTADVLTGRGVATANETVGRMINCSGRHVQRARSVFKDLGYMVDAAVGRYLTSEERAEANAVHGGDQRRMGSQRALTVPRPVQDVHLPRRGAVNDSSSSRSELPTRADARDRAATRPAPKRKTPKPGRQRPSLPVQRLAGHLARRLPWLARGHIGSLCATLTGLGLDDDGWSANDVMNLLDQRNAENGLYALPPASQRNPLALFAHQARTALADVAEPPKRRRARETAEREAARARARIEHQAAEDRWQAQRDDPAAQARIAAAKADIRATLEQARRRRAGVTTTVTLTPVPAGASRISSMPKSRKRRKAKAKPRRTRDRNSTWPVSQVESSWVNDRANAALLARGWDATGRDPELASAGDLWDWAVSEPEQDEQTQTYYEPTNVIPAEDGLTVTFATMASEGPFDTALYPTIDDLLADIDVIEAFRHQDPLPALPHAAAVTHRIGMAAHRRGEGD